MTKKDETPDLAYLGANHLLGIPARDLTADEIDQHGWNAAELIASGLYEPVKPAKQPAKGKE